MKPNIIIFNPDEFRADALAHLNNAGVQSPTLDHLVKTEATSFRNAFCQNPVCTPSRCSFMTGLYPHVNGHRTMDYMLHADHGEPSLLRILKDNGYFIWWGGKNDLVPAQNGFAADADIKFNPSEEDYKRWNVTPPNNWRLKKDWRGNIKDDTYYSFYKGKLGDDEGNYFDYDSAMIKGAVEFIENYKGKKPFVIYLPLIYPHPPYGVQEPFFSNIDRTKIKKRRPDLHDNQYGKKPQILHGIRNGQHLQDWSEERYEELRGTYYGMCSRIDSQVDTVITKLKQKELWDDSAFFFFSDHGDYTGDYGIVEKNQNTFEDPLVNVPLVIKLPKSTKQKTNINNSLVELIDISATIYDITDITPPYWTFGKSLLPLLEGKSSSHRTEVHSEGGRLEKEIAANEHTHFEVFKPAIESLYYPRVSLQQKENPCVHAKATMIRTKKYKYIKRMLEEDEFYDLEIDCNEELNQINNPKYKDIIFDLKERMLSWYQNTCDTVPFTADKRG